MPEIPIDTLRALRDRADRLLDSVVSDLRPFQHDDNLTFRRKPDSLSHERDVNVATTCSCLMALALTNTFDTFYELENGKSNAKEHARDILRRIVEAPWMSSGLTTNNAFTTSLVLRAYGFLVHYGLLNGDVTVKKQWTLELGSSEPNNLFRQLKAEWKSDATQFVYGFLSDNTRDLLKKAELNCSAHDENLIDSLKADLYRIIHYSGWIYTKERFPDAGDVTLQGLLSDPDGYALVPLNHALMASAFPEVKMPQERSLREIAQVMAENGKHFRINDYEPAAAVIYWFVQGVWLARIELTDDAWTCLRDLAREEFNRQRSLVLAEHDAMMDPVALGMAACLCARLRAIFTGKAQATALLASLPSTVELEHSIKQMFRHQTGSGIWPKYFPMFHYQEAGSNFCFTFELLEAVLNEFGATDSKLLDDPSIIAGFEKAVAWCEYRLKTSHKENRYCGWNSGGDLKTLRNNQPESWATAVVHMFLWELRNVLSNRIQAEILVKYKAKTVPRTEDCLNQMLDIELSFESQPASLKDVLKTQLVQPNMKLDGTEVRRKRIKQPMSALFFGPPGTSKTRAATAVAEALGWPLLTVNPSEFVKRSLDNVYLQADEIFQDLNDLAAVVVFFDEMDPLMQSRDGTGLDTATQFLTTSMLPRLTTLHDKGQVIFLVATNYQSRFDPALLRAGRFDLLLCMGPPTFKDKVDKLASFFPKGKLDKLQEERAQAAFRELAPDSSPAYFQLELYMFAEFKGFLNTIGNEKDIGDTLKALDKETLQKKVDEYSKHVTLRIKDLPEAYQTFSSWNDVQVPELSAGPRTEIEKYLKERGQSKRQ